MSVIEKIVEIPVTYRVPILDCQHAGRVSTFKDMEVGDEQQCLACKQNMMSGLARFHRIGKVLDEMGKEEEGWE